MPITVNYSPINLLATLATQAGQVEGQKTANQQSLAAAALSLQYRQAESRAQGGGKAFSLQDAYAAQADRELAASRRTPAADHIKEANDLRQQTRQARQSEVKGQLDKLLADGTIDQVQYQKGLMAAMTDNDTLMNQILAAPKDNISASQDLSMIRQKYQQRRRDTQTKYTASMKETYGDPAKGAAVDGQFTTDLAALDKAESDEVEALRTKGNKITTASSGYSGDSFSVTNGDTITNLLPGAVSKRPPGYTPTSQPASSPDQSAQTGNYATDPSRIAPYLIQSPMARLRSAGSVQLGGSNIPDIKGADDPLYHALPGGTYYRRPDGTMAQKSMVGSSPAIQKLTGKTSQDIIAITGDDDPLFDALPAGSMYRGPDGVVRKK